MTVDDNSADAIACTLDAQAMPQRLDEWSRVLDQAVARELRADGIRLTFASTIDVAELATLAAAEHHCCAFMDFAITIETRGIALEVRAPSDGVEVVHALFGDDTHRA